MFQIGDRRWLNADFPEVTSQLSIIGLSWADAAGILQTIETARLVQRSAHVFQERARRTGMDLTKNRERLFQAFRRVVLLGKVFAKHFIALFCLEKLLQSISSRCFAWKSLCKAFHRVVLLGKAFAKHFIALFCLEKSLQSISSRFFVWRRHYWVGGTLPGIVLH